MSTHPAAEFIRLLTGDAEMPCVFQWFADYPAAPVQPSHKNKPLSAILPSLQKLNAEGAGIFLTINATNGGRYASDVTGLRSLFVDGDGLDQPDFWALPPTIVQARAANKWHAFWRLNVGEDIRRFRPAQKALAALYGSDPKVSDPSRVMRLPGFQHQKDQDFPSVYVMSEMREVSYTINEVLIAHKIDPASIVPETSAPIIPVAFDGHDITPDEREILLGALPQTNTGRHFAALWWTVNAVGACLPAEEIAETLSNWFLAYGRPPQRPEINNLMRDARTALLTGKMQIDIPGLRTDLTFKPVAVAATAIATDALPPLSPEAAAAQTAEIRAETPWLARVVRNKDGSWKNHVRNVQLVLEHTEALGNCFRFNAFSCRVEVLRSPWRKWTGTAEWTDKDTTGLAQWCAQEVSGQPAFGPEAIDAAVAVRAAELAYHPVRDYLDALHWDGTPRLASWLVTYLGAPDTPYHRAVGMRFLIGAVARVMRPGCQMDTALVLEGEQGTGKSSAVRVLFGDWFTDALIDITHKDAALTIRGHWGVELGEMHAFSRGEQTAVKAYISRREDRQRDSHERKAETHPRGCVFIGTTNQEFHQHDATGGRRFWPVACRHIRLDRLAADRDQVWAEAVTCREAGEPHYLTPTEEAVAQVEQDKRYLQDEWVERIKGWLDINQNFDVSTHVGVTGSEVFIGALGGEVKHLKRTDQIRIAECMRKLGFKGGIFRRGGKPIRGYLPVTSVSEPWLRQ